MDSQPEGSIADCFRVKIYGDKQIPIKIFLHRAVNVRPRYEISAQLRSILPFIQVDPTQEDVLAAIWQYLLVQGLIGEGRFISLTPVSFDIFIFKRYDAHLDTYILYGV